MQYRRYFSFYSSNALFAHAWSTSPAVPLRIALASCNLGRRNELELIEFSESLVQLVKIGSFQTTFPASHVQFGPLRDQPGPDLLAASSDMLRIYEIYECGDKKPSYKASKDSVQLTVKAYFKSAQRKLSPMTYFDWSELDATKIAVSLYDSTYSLFDIVKEAEIASYQLHERSINCLEISPLEFNILTTGSSDGTVRILDYRSNLQQQICQMATPILRVKFNRANPQQIAVLENASTAFSIYDLRYPLQPLLLQKHKAEINDICWNPLNQTQILSVAVDKNAFIWEYQRAAMCYTCAAEVNSCGWSVLNNDWCSVCSGGLLELLHI